MVEVMKANLYEIEKGHENMKEQYDSLKEAERAVQGSSSMKCKTCLKLISTNTFIGHINLCENIYSIPLDITVCDYIKQTSPHEKTPHYAYNISIGFLDTTWYISKRFKQLWLLNKKLISCFQYNKQMLTEYLNATKHLTFEDKSEKLSDKEKAKLANDRMFFIRDYLAAIVDLDCKYIKLIYRCQKECRI